MVKSGTFFSGIVMDSYMSFFGSFSIMIFTLNWCKWNFFAWCLVILLRAMKPTISSTMMIIIMMKLVALSIGNITKSSFNSRKPCMGNCKRTVSNQKPANSGTFSVRLPK